MIVRFSLYGFLKNQRYFEPFLVLALLDKGLSFFAIGLLVAWREIAVNLLEIPSGAGADLFGRRRAMMVSFGAYIAGFVVLGVADHVALLVLAMTGLAVGDAFRTGTHKAMIFAWLEGQGRLAERTAVYGYTRSWSKIGSAVSALIAAAFVLVSGRYDLIFFASAVPYLIGIVNFLGYPAALDGVPAERAPGTAVAAVWRHTREALGDLRRRPGLRRLVFESMGFEGTFHAVKDYLQPVLTAAGVAWLGGVAASGGGLQGLSEARRTALLVGPVYFGLHLLSSLASRRAHRLATAAGGEPEAACWLWWGALGIFVMMALAGWLGALPVLVAAFVLLHVGQNLWRPILISRFDTEGSAAKGATLLSIESQSRRLATAALAPLLGLAVDAAGGGAGAFWPLGVAGSVVALAFALWRRPA